MSSLFEDTFTSIKCNISELGSLFYLYLTGVDLLPAVLNLLCSVMVLRGADALLFLLILLILFILSSLWRVEPVGTEALQQRSYSLGFGQLGNLEVLFVVWCVFSDQTLLLCWKGWPLVLLVTPLTILLIVFIPTTDDGLLRKVHSGLQEERNDSMKHYG